MDLVWEILLAHCKKEANCLSEGVYVLWRKEYLQLVHKMIAEMSRDRTVPLLDWRHWGH